MVNQNIKYNEDNDKKYFAGIENVPKSDSNNKKPKPMNESGQESENLEYFTE